VFQTRTVFFVDKWTDLDCQQIDKQINEWAKENPSKSSMIVDIKISSIVFDGQIYHSALVIYKEEVE
jgi:hypothetical protein